MGLVFIYITFGLNISDQNFPTSARLKNPWKGSMMVGTGLASSARFGSSCRQDLHSLPAPAGPWPQDTAASVWSGLEDSLSLSSLERRTCRASRICSWRSWVGPQDINWSDRLLQSPPDHHVAHCCCSSIGMSCKANSLLSYSLWSSTQNY